MKEMAINAARRLCDTMMRKYPEAKDLPPEGKFLYHQGVFLSGMMKTYELTGEEKYFHYIKDWVDSIIDEDGNIDWHDPSMLDYLQPGILLFPLYEKTKEEKYKQAIYRIADYLRNWPKNDIGGFWHKYELPNQMWLDGLYMGAPFHAEFSAFSKEEKFLDEAVKQALIMYENTLDEKTGLLFHVWDSGMTEPWADPQTGCSPEIWSRGLGWYTVAIMDIIEYLPKEYGEYKALEKIVKTLFTNIMKYRDDEKKIWYQVVDKKNAEGNWLEGSGSFLYIAAFAKAIRCGILDNTYKDFTNESFDGAYNSVTHRGEDILVDNVCIWTSVGDYDNYIGRPTSENDLHGVGAFLLMCCEVAMMN